MGMVWHCTPAALRWISLPYGVHVYARMLRQCHDLGELGWMHRDLYRRSLVFRLLRPRYRLVDSYLRRFMAAPACAADRAAPASQSPLENGTTAQGHSPPPGPKER
jgi:hypothetical protein